MSKVKWGVLSTSKFALTKIVPALRQCQYAEVAAIASRDLDKAQTVAQQYRIAKAYGSYEELLADAEIDVIYNPMPNHLHVPWSIRLWKRASMSSVKSPSRSMPAKRRSYWKRGSSIQGKS